MLRFTSLAAAAALLASTGIALAQTPSYPTDRYSNDRFSNDRWTTTQSYQRPPSYQNQPSQRSFEMNRFGASQCDRFGTSQTDRFGPSRVERFGTAPMSGSTVEPRTTIRERGVGMTGGQFASEADARSRCGGDTVVWVNTRSHVYHFPGSPDFGHTKRGAFMCRADADRAGSFRPAKDEMRGRMGMTGSSTAPLRNSFPH